MSEQNNTTFGNGGDIDLGGGSLPMDFDPFASTPEAPTQTNTTQIPATPELPDIPETPQPPMLMLVEPEADEDAGDEPEQESEPAPIPKTSAPKTAPTANPLEQAMDAAATKEADAAKESIFSRLPQFVYANATEDITDSSKTFEDLRLEKATDFPELEDGKRVSWTVEYGKVTKSVSDAKGTTVAKMKMQIETSKEFLDALKKMKPDEREKAVCKIKPRVTAQSKGDIAAYKGIFSSVEDAEASGKIISIIPARDGQVYEMRKNEIGTFITPAGNVPELSVVRAGFIPALPLIPLHLLQKVVGFFKSFMDVERQYEALVHIVWDKQFCEYCVKVPEQTVSKVSVHATLEQDYDPEREIHVMDIHSHNNMAARFSATDDADEKATRLYAVIGRLDRYWPSINVRLSNGGKFLSIKPEQVFEDVHEAFPHEWAESVTLPSPRPNLAKVHLAEYARLTVGGEEA